LIPSPNDTAPPFKYSPTAVADLGVGFIALDSTKTKLTAKVMCFGVDYDQSRATAVHFQYMLAPRPGQFVLVLSSAMKPTPRAAVSFAGACLKGAARRSWIASVPPTSRSR